MGSMSQLKYKLFLFLLIIDNAIINRFTIDLKNSHFWNKADKHFDIFNIYFKITFLMILQSSQAW